MGKRLKNRTIETKVQVLDATGDPVTAATVNWKVYDPDDSEFDSGTMVHIGDGIYSVAWTPNISGHWTCECYSADPKFYKSFTYFVEEDICIADGESYGPQTGPQDFIVWYDREAHTVLLGLHDFTGQVIIKVYAYLDGDWRLLNTATFPDDFPDDVTVVQVEIPRAAQGVNRKITVQTPVNEGESRTIYYSEVTEHETDLTTEEEDYHEPD